MNKKEAQKFKDLLIKKREEILEEIRNIAKESAKSIKESSGDLSSYSLHMADLASDNYDREFSLNIASGEQELLYEIDEAIKRINEGKYGKCLACNKKIRVKRLRAIPYTKYCIKCQSKEEADKRGPQ